jgi:hypothetical protein
MNLTCFHHGYNRDRARASLCSIPDGNRGVIPCGVRSARFVRNI